MRDEAISNPILAPDSEAATVAPPDSPKSTTRRTFLQTAGLSTALASCGGGGSSQSGTFVAPSTPPAGSPSPTPSAAASTQDAQVARFALRAAFSATRGRIDQIKRLGFEAWLDRQFDAPNDETAEQYFSRLGLDRVTQDRPFGDVRAVDSMIWSQLFSGGNETRKRIALSLSQFFVVSMTGLDFDWRSQAIGHYWDLLNEHAFGNFRHLLEATTLSPAMGEFLDMRGSKRAEPNSGSVPDENFAREVMQLFTIGLEELELDGTVKLSGGRPIETYGNSDVVGLAKAFSGYDLDHSKATYLPDPRFPRQMIASVDVVRMPMTADASKWRVPSSESFHSLEAKRFLGTTIPPGTDAERTLKIALDTLYNHPNVGPFFAKQMIQRLVTSNPSPGYVRRVASAFNNNGDGVRGDLRAVFKAILLDDEAQSSDGLTSPFFGKLREPMVRLAQWGRTFRAQSSSGAWETRILAEEDLLAQSPFRARSVFNFFRPGFVLGNSQSAANNMVAPEFQIASETTVAAYVNFIRRTIENRTFWFPDIQASYDEEIEMADKPQELIDHLDLILTGQQLSAFTKNATLEAIESVAISGGSRADRLRRVQIALTILMSSNDYLIQK